MFDCRRPGEAYQRRVCANADLRTADVLLYESFRHALRSAPDPNRLRYEQDEWTQNLRNCSTDALCLEYAYYDRISTLRRYSEAVPTEQNTDRSYGPAEPLDVDPVPAQLDRSVSDLSPSPVATDPTVLALAEEQAGSGTQTDVRDRTPPSAALTDVHSPSANKPTEAVVPARPTTMGSLLVGAMILTPIIVLIVALLATRSLANHSMQRYGWPMILNWWNILHLASGFALWLGVATGNLVVGLVVALGLWVIVAAVNVKNTNIVTGILMSLIQPFVVAILFVVFQLARYKPKPYNYVNKV